MLIDGKVIVIARYEAKLTTCRAAIASYLAMMSGCNSLFK